MLRAARLILALLVPWLATTAAGHGAAPRDASSIWLQWNLAPSVLVPLVVAAGFYALGVFRLWHRAGRNRGISMARVAAYTLGIVALVVALVSPLDAAAGGLFSLHMIQHLLLILVAPPLLVTGNPDVALLWALPKPWRRGWARFEDRAGRSLTHGKGPLVVILLTTGMLWVWHLPQLYDLAVQNEAVHWAEHAGFLITALLFWITILRLRVQDHLGNGLRILYVFGMALQGSLLGALITFASRPLYRSHLNALPEWGLTALADQQLAGLIMWVPPAVLYIGIAAYLFFNWLAAVDAQDRARDAVRTRT